MLTARKTWSGTAGRHAINLTQFIVIHTAAPFGKPREREVGPPFGHSVQIRATWLTNVPARSVRSVLLAGIDASIDSTGSIFSPEDVRSASLERSEIDITASLSALTIIIVFIGFWRRRRYDDTDG